MAWDGAFDGADPDTSAVSEEEEALVMPNIINLQESGLRRSPRTAKQNAISKISVLTTLFFLEQCL